MHIFSCRVNNMETGLKILCCNTDMALRARNDFTCLRVNVSGICRTSLLSVNDARNAGQADGFR